MPGNWTCWFWTLVGAGCLGWGIKGMVLGPVMDEKRREVERLKSKVTMLTNQPPEVRTVEKRVEVPVERVVVKHVEVPVEKVVDRPVENPEHLARIKALEGEVAMIAGLLPQIAQLQALASQVGGRSIEERVVVPVENPEHLARIKAVEEEIVVIAGFLAQIAQAQTAASQVGEVRSLEDRTAVQVDSQEHLARIKALEDEVAVIADLRAQMAELRDLLLQVGEKVGEKLTDSPTEQKREVPTVQVSEQAVDLDDKGTAARADEGEAVEESPDDLQQIYGVGPALERFLHKRGVFWFRQVATWSQADIDKFEFLLPNFGGRIQRENWVHSAKVEHHKKYKEWLGEGEPPSESLDLPAQMAEPEAVSLQTGEKIAETLAEKIVVKNEDMSSETISEPARDLDHAGAVGRADEGEAVEESPDDLKQIYGVGPALERFLHKRGVFWFRQVATWSQADIDKFEFLLPNFGGRIQRENWVHSAKVEHHKKYKEWLGEDEPPSESLDLPARMAEPQAASSQTGEHRIETQTETPTEQNREVPPAQLSEDPVDRNYDSPGDSTDEREAVGESPDDLKQIRGVGPALERFLHKRGVFWFRQVATWSQADIDKFEFLLPNFGGRIQRENWVHSAKVEHHKKYKEWLGEGEPPSESLDLPARMAEPQAASSQTGEHRIETQTETPVEKIVVQKREVLSETISEPVGDLGQASATESADEGEAVGESPDDLQQIYGVGPALEQFLHKRGVFWFSQVATWNQADIDKFEFLLPNFEGRIQRENWVRSAKVEHYKKYKQWLGDDQPPSTTPEIH